LTQETADAPTQETADAPTQPAPLAQPQKKSAQPQNKAKQPAGPNEKAHAKREREAPQATARAKGDKPAVQEQAADSISQKPAGAAPTVVPSSRADQPLNAESRNENLVPTAAAAWPIIPNTEGAGAGGAAADTTEAANANAVQLVDPNEVNELDRAAETAQAESSWSTYLLLLLGAVLAAASAMWFLVKMACTRAGQQVRACIPVSGSKSPPADDDPHLGFVRGADFGRAD
jgi:hypothetical protein